MSPPSSATQRKYETLGLILLATGLLALVEFFYAPGGNHILRTLFGKGSLPLAVFLLLLGFYLTFRRLLQPLIGPHWYAEAILGSELLLIALTAAYHLRLGNDSVAHIYDGSGGGMVGWAIASTLLAQVGLLPAWLILIGLGMLGAILLFHYTPVGHLPVRGLPVALELEPVEPAEEQGPQPATEPAPTSSRLRSRKRAAGRQRPAAAPARAPGGRRSQKLPPLTLLRTQDSGGATEAQAQIQARIIEDTLNGFGIPAEVVDINVGPTVTQFGVSPGVYERGGKLVRVRVNKIVSLADDLALALAASPVRIEAPVPGRPYVGIEVPNAETTLVGLRSVLQDRNFRAIRSPLAIPIGRDVRGEVVAADLHKLPHLLIAGATGSGKSVAINAMLCALLFNNLPERLRLVLVDPKRVELVNYNGVPHLLAPVVTDAKHAEGALSWLLLEMDERYRKFSEQGVRHIVAYNNKVGLKSRLPFIVMVVDELADLMLVAPESIEAKLVRLAQMARATGIHLIIATQRPSVDVVTGLIKANFPARLAFAVTSQVDSRVILDTPGAEKLLGRGDGLFMTADSAELRRIQGCFVSDGEIQALVDWWRKNAATPGPDPAQPRYPWSHLMVEEATADDLLANAIESLRGRQSITISALQRLLNIGYPRAARLMQTLEERGIVGPEGDPRQGRPVLLDDEDLSLD
ncbi:MAG: DNA translocase FtsK [Chloroflexi bacterium]|nr:MAG: DNA translocase FtsK [Chloroflexota bacterium]